MKITIEPTSNKDYTSCSISCESDDLTLPAMFDNLIIPALLGIGFARETINDYLEIEE